jgi:hypothetical protein
MYVCIGREEESRRRDGVSTNLSGDLLVARDQLGLSLFICTPNLDSFDGYMIAYT